MYGYVQGDPINSIDPEGLQLVISGNDSDRQRLFGFVQGMGCGQLSMDGSGNVTGTFSEEESNECSPCNCLKKIIESPRYVYVQFHKDAWWANGSAWDKVNTVRMAPEYRSDGQTEYQYHKKGGGTAFHQPEAAMAHELLGHACDAIQGDNSDNQSRAIEQANKIRRRKGWPERDPFYSW